MKICTTAAEIQHELGSFDNERIALVPTMGCLHEGHISLIDKAKRLADVVVVSIYVNPLQFGAHEDLDTYPRTFEADVQACKRAGVDFIFYPQHLYPEHGIEVRLKTGAMGQRLCGIRRKGHFDGVVTVVAILFHIIRPHLAIFGEKDFQQLTLIQRMVSDLYVPVEIIAGKTVREDDGLAKSSRNRYLNPQERKQAAAIYAAMQQMQTQAGKGDSVEAMLASGRDYLQAHGLEVEYLEICHESNLMPVQTLKPDTFARIFVAARIGTTRLIDNMPLISNPAEE